jgi:hypothetical protein
MGETFDFSEALKRLRAGARLTRIGWNGRGMFIYFVHEGTVAVNNHPVLQGPYLPGTRLTRCAHVDMVAADNTVVPWLASQTDILADDWCVAN